MGNIRFGSTVFRASKAYLFLRALGCRLPDHPRPARSVAEEEANGIPTSSGTSTPGTWRSSIITGEGLSMPIARTRQLAGPVPHPGELLKDELEARGLSAHALSIALRLQASR